MVLSTTLRPAGQLSPLALQAMDQRRPTPAEDRMIQAELRAACEEIRSKRQPAAHRRFAEIKKPQPVEIAVIRMNDLFVHPFTSTKGIRYVGQ